MSMSTDCSAWVRSTTAPSRALVTPWPLPWALTGTPYAAAKRRAVRDVGLVRDVDHHSGLDIDGKVQATPDLLPVGLARAGDPAVDRADKVVEVARREPSSR